MAAIFDGAPEFVDLTVVDEVLQEAQPRITTAGRPALRELW